MKTSEYKCPWEPRADDQEVSKENRSAAKEQLGMISNTYKSSNFKDFSSHLPLHLCSLVWNCHSERDVLRFSEIVPDEKLSDNVEITTAIAFPLHKCTPECPENHKEIITSDDTDEDILRKIGLPISSTTEETNTNTERLYRVILGRYLHGLLSVPLVRPPDALMEAIKKLEQDSMDME